MACPVCGGTDFETVNVRMKKESDLKQVVGSTWAGRNVGRCNGCGVLYDHRYADSGGGDEYADSGGSDDRADGSRRVPEKVNCPDCGSRNPGGRDVCSYCGSSLE